MKTFPAPLPTVYGGYAFRSRLEARWGVFFDTAGIPWHYEMEDFNLPTGRYLPDFWLPNQRCWIEIKPTRPTEREGALAGELSAYTQRNVFIFFGQIPRDVQCGGPVQDVDSAYWYSQGGYTDNLYNWTQCPHCGLLGIEFDARAARLSCRCLEGDKSYNGDSPLLLTAYERARQARFEFEHCDDWRRKN